MQKVARAIKKEFFSLSHTHTDSVQNGHRHAKRSPSRSAFFPFCTSLTRPEIAAEGEERWPRENTHVPDRDLSKVFPTIECNLPLHFLPPQATIRPEFGWEDRTTATTESGPGFQRVKQETRSLEALHDWI